MKGGKAWLQTCAPPRNQPGHKRKMDTAILRLHCADTKGIVYNVSKFIFERGGNIITSSQHKEELDEQFFMRVHFDCADIASTREELLQGLAELAGQFSMETQITFSEDRLSRIDKLTLKGGNLRVAPS